VNIIKNSSPNVDYGDLNVVCLETLTELVCSKKTAFYRDFGRELVDLSIALIGVNLEDDQDGYAHSLHSQSTPMPDDPLHAKIPTNVTD
jgi:hypothetical protein